MQVELLDPDALVPYERNARTHSEQQIEQIAASLREFGFVNPILADADNVIIAGHGRLLAARKLGLAKVPVVRVEHLTDAQRRAYTIADNRLALDAAWDYAILSEEMEELVSEGIELELLGFSDKELKTIFAEDEEQTPDQPVPVVPPVARTQAGDVWLLGRHRLLCGDCRDPDAVRRLIGERKINLAFTSPPYAEQREYDAASGFKPIPPDEYVEWFAAVAANIKASLAQDGSWFVNIKPSADGLDTSLYVFDLVIAHVRQWGWHFATEFCWERGGMPKAVRSRFKNQFEPIYQFAVDRWKIRPEAVMHRSDHVPKPRGKGAGNTNWSEHQGGGLRSIDPVANQGKPGFEWFGDHIETAMAYPGNRLPTFAGSHDATGHAAAFPVGLPEWFIKAYTDPDDAVFDPFMGSGSTLLACEKQGRDGFGTELSPLYCDVIIMRWQGATGLEATRESDGATFDSLSAG